MQPHFSIITVYNFEGFLSRFTGVPTTFTKRSASSLLVEGHFKPTINCYLRWRYKDAVTFFKPMLTSNNLFFPIRWRFFHSVGNNTNSIVKATCQPGNDELIWHSKSHRFKENMNDIYGPIPGIIDRCITFQQKLFQN